MEVVPAFRILDRVERERGVPHHRGEEVVEIVRDPAGQPADGFHLLRLSQLLFQALAFRHVAPDGEVAPRHHLGLLGEFDDARLAIDADQAHLAARFTGGEKCRPALADVSDIQRVDQLVEAGGQGIAASGSEQAVRRGVDVEKASIVVQHHERVERVVEDRMEQFVALSQSGLGLLPARRFFIQGLGLAVQLIEMADAIVQPGQPVSERRVQHDRQGRHQQQEGKIQLAEEYGEKGCCIRAPQKAQPERLEIVAPHLDHRALLFESHGQGDEAGVEEIVNGGGHANRRQEPSETRGIARQLPHVREPINVCPAIHIASGAAARLNTKRRGARPPRASRTDTERQSSATASVAAAGPATSKTAKATSRQSRSSPE